MTVPSEFAVRRAVGTQRCMGKCLSAFVPILAASVLGKAHGEGAGVTNVHLIPCT